MIETQKSKKLDYKGLNKEETKILKRMRKKKTCKIMDSFSYSTISLKKKACCPFNLFLYVDRSWSTTSINSRITFFLIQNIFGNGN
jgi:hypothetical protein